MRIKLFGLLIFLVLMLLGSEYARACVCFAPTPTCRIYSGAEVVFVAKVLSSKIEVRDLKRDEDSREIPYKAKFQVSQLQIKEIFTGIDEGTEIEIETDNYSSCSFSLAKDIEYLIYGYKDEKTGKYSTGFCSGTKPVTEAKEDLDYLRATKNLKGMSVKGSVVYSPIGKYFYQDVPKNNFNILQQLGVNTVTLTNSETNVQTKINQDGTYNFENIPKGKYSLKVVLPESLKTLENYHPDIAEELGIKDRNLVNLIGHGCHIEDFTVVDNGRVTGKVVDADGNSVDDITVNLIPVNVNGQKLKTEEACYDDGLCLETNKNGDFYFDGIRAGHYLIGIRSDDYIAPDSIDASFPVTYFPNSKNTKKAKIITVQKGRAVQNIVIKLFPKFKETTVQGRVFFKDGRPASKVFVRYVARTPDYKDSGIVFIKTDENGFFSFKGYENHFYLIGSFTDYRQGNKNAFAVEQEIFIKGKPKELKFVLDRTNDENCKECRDYSKFPKRPKQKKN